MIRRQAWKQRALKAEAERDESRRELLDYAKLMDAITKADLAKRTHVCGAGCPEVYNHEEPPSQH